MKNTSFHVALLLGSLCLVVPLQAQESAHAHSGHAAEKEAADHAYADGHHGAHAHHGAHGGHGGHGDHGAHGGHGTVESGAVESGHASAHAGCPFADGSEQPPSSAPAQVGQDAFAALAEMRALLDADPATDWARVDFRAFREHLVDMNRVVLDAEVAESEIEGGFEALVTGHGRTLAAIERMVPAHARFMDQQPGLSVSIRELSAAADGDARGVALRVEADDPAAAARLKGLGFFGFLASGDHHRPHHRMMATGAAHP